jgi:MacB-like periplasmic core domain
MSTLAQDIRYAFRRLRQAPAFVAICVITLALGIGATTAIFTLMDAVMLKSLPVVNPSRLYRLGDNDNCCVLGGLQDDWGIYSYALYKQFRDHTPQFEELAGFQAGLSSLSVRRNSSSAPAEPYQGEYVSGNYFSMFGVGAYAGRTLTPADDQPNAPPAAVMSYRTWQEHFGLDPSVIGSAFTINTVPFTVVGVAPPGFFGDTLRPDPPDFFLPLSAESALNGQNSILNNPGLNWLYAIGRLKPGAKPVSVQSETTVELQRWIKTQPDLTDYQRTRIPKQHIVLAPAGAGVETM